MKVLVTGGCGFIGSHLAKRLYNEGHDVTIVDIQENPYMKYKYYTKKVIGDLRDARVALKVTKGMDRVYHLAANMGGIGYITTVFGPIMRDNALIDINVLEACRINKVPRMFYASSACVYPMYKQKDNPNIKLKEEDVWPYDPDRAYGFEKLFMEKLCESYWLDYKVETRIARFHNIYGPEGTWKGGKEKAPAALCRKVAEAPDGGEIEIWGDGTQTRSFCYIDDCIEAFIRLMESDIREPLNIGTDEAVTISQLADIIIEISGKRLTKRFDPTKPVGVNYRNADITKIRKLLGWEPKVPLRKGLEITYNWIKEQVEKERHGNNRH